MFKRYLNLKNEAEKYYEFYDKFHTIKNGIEAGKNTSIDKSNAKVNIDKNKRK